MKGRVVQRGPGWLHAGALSPKERILAHEVTLRLLRLWYVRRRGILDVAAAVPAARAHIRGAVCSPRETTP